MAVHLSNELDAVRAELEQMYAVRAKRGLTSADRVRCAALLAREALLLARLPRR